MKKHNLHTHTTYSDGRCSPDILVEQAKHSLDILGICDHAFSRKLPDIRQITSRLERYLHDLQSIRDLCRPLELLIGVEIDLSQNYGISPGILPFDVLNQFDYILFEYVNTENEYWGIVGTRDITELLEVRHLFTVPCGLAHNDLQQNFEGREGEIATLLKNHDIFVELNQSELHLRRGVGRNTREGRDYYTHFSPLLLNQFRDNAVKVIIGTDTHTGDNLARIGEVTQFIEHHNLHLHDLVQSL